MNAIEGAVLVPVVVGDNRVRGGGEGAMYDDDAKGTAAIDVVIRRALVAAEGEAKPEWVAKVRADFLRLFYAGWKEHKSAQDPMLLPTLFVFEFEVPSIGARVIMGQRQVLERLRGATGFVVVDEAAG